MRTEWPELDYAQWRDTKDTLHRYTQMIGKLRLALVPPTNHWWSAALTVTARGLSTLAMPYAGGAFEVTFDFVEHECLIYTSWGDRRIRELGPVPVAEFYRELMATLRSMNIEVPIWDVPMEIPDDATPFSRDTQHRAYDPDAVERFFQTLLSTKAVLEQFRARFTGKCSPVHFFWGGFDLAVTRFSGRRAPERFKDAVNRESYSEEVSSVGFWPGDARYPHAAFYSYASPQPAGFDKARIEPESAVWADAMGLWVLPYDALRESRDPDRDLLSFCETTYEAAATLAQWPRELLERPLILPRRRSMHEQAPIEPSMEPTMETPA